MASMLNVPYVQSTFHAMINGILANEGNSKICILESTRKIVT
jgi:hypothetical protein